MSIEALTWVLKFSETKLGARLVLLSLADHAHGDGTEAYPSVKTIAEQSRMSERNVQRCLRVLEEEGHITKTGVTEHGTSVYELRGVNMSPKVKDGSKDGSGDKSDASSARSVTPMRQIAACPDCGVTPRGKTLAQHREDVHGVRAA